MGGRNSELPYGILLKHVRQKRNAVANLILKLLLLQNSFSTLERILRLVSNTHHAGYSSYENRTIIVQERVGK